MHGSIVAVTVLFAADSNPITAEPDFWRAYAWACGFVLLYDLFDRRLNTGSWRAIVSESFWFYTVAHMLLAALATWLVIGQVNTPWLAGLISALGTETVLSNADVRFGDKPLVPISEWFRALRAKNDETIGLQREATLLRLRNRLTEQSMEWLVEAWTGYFVNKLGLAKAHEKLAELKSASAGKDASLKAQLATDLVASNVEYVKQLLRK